MADPDPISDATSATPKDIADLRMVIRVIGAAYFTTTFIRAGSGPQVAPAAGFRAVDYFIEEVEKQHPEFLETLLNRA